jgi:hypothetical protein
MAPGQPIPSATNAALWYAHRSFPQARRRWLNAAADKLDRYETDRRFNCWRRLNELQPTLLADHGSGKSYADLVVACGNFSRPCRHSLEQRCHLGRQEGRTPSPWLAERMATTSRGERATALTPSAEHRSYVQS